MSRSIRLALIVCSAVTLGAATLAQQPPPGGPPTAPGAGGRGGRGGLSLPGATPEQLQAVTAMNAALAEQVMAVTAARADLTQATFAVPKNAAAIGVALEKVRAAELAVATKRADEFAKLQSSANTLNPEQVSALVAAAANAGGRGGRL